MVVGGRSGRRKGRGASRTVWSTVNVVVSIRIGLIGKVFQLSLAEFDNGVEGIFFCDEPDGDPLFARLGVVEGVRGIVKYPEEVGKIVRRDVVEDEGGGKGFAGRVKGGIIAIFKPSSKHKGISFEEVTVDAERNVLHNEVEVSAGEPVGGMTGYFGESWLYGHGG